MLQSENLQKRNYRGRIVIWQLPLLKWNDIVNGKIIKLGDFGTFRTTLSGDGVATEEEFNTKKIKKLNIRFRPAREFRNLLASVKFEKVQ